MPNYNNDNDVEAAGSGGSLHDSDGQSVQSGGGSGADDSSTNTGGGSQSMSSKSGQSSTTGTSYTGMSSKNAIPEAILATKEAKQVQWSKCIMLAVIATSAIVAGALTYVLVSQAEQQDFESQYTGYALEIDDVSRHNSKAVFNVLDSYATTITSYASKTNSVWPNVTVPHFELRGDKFKTVSGAHLVSVSPIVSNVQEWNEYAYQNQMWIQESFNERSEGETLSFSDFPTQMYYHTSASADDRTWDNEPELQIDGMLYSPLWQEATVPHDVGVLNYNLLSHEAYAKNWRIMKASKIPVISEVIDPSELLGAEAVVDHDDGLFHPESLILNPIFEDPVGTASNTSNKVVATLIAVLAWDEYFTNLLHAGATGIIVTMRDTCGDDFSYRIDGPHATFLGEGDQHDPKYDHLEYIVPFSDDASSFIYEDNDDAEAHCHYSLHVYPSAELEAQYTTNRPIIFTIVVVCVFLFTSIVFICYDILVTRRQEKVQQAAIRSNAIVSSLFPANVRDQLFQQATESDPKSSSKAYNKKSGGSGGKDGMEVSSKFRLKTFLGDDDNNKNDANGKDGEGDDDNAAIIDAVPEMYETKPIADLFPNSTVMFADIAGFTAWSSVREPSQVFTLLETVYKAFDTIAKRRRVFKVETVGDCYVAVTGLPEPRKDHAVAMCKFARDCMVRMNELTRHLEVILGPDTGDLAMRFGLHSGPVTAGVLRGDKSRFQLFGDTVNTAARVETTGLRNRIHLSNETAQLLKDAGKTKWIVAREDTVVAKGKGELETYWLLPKDSTNPEEFSRDVAAAIKERNGEIEKAAAEEAKSGIPDPTVMNMKIQRLVDWNVDVLKRLLKLIVAKRIAADEKQRSRVLTAQSEAVKREEKAILSKHEMPLNEVVEIINMPKFDARTQRNQLDPNAVELSVDVVTQLREYVESIAAQYRQNPFHNFEHASHVTMSVSKLLSRIVAPDIDVENEDNIAANLHDHTYGITSDPLTQFAVVISALVHDVDHVGIPNFLLGNENKTLGDIYKNKSIAEQNSVDLAWDTLMEDRFTELRSCIYGDASELGRFRQLIAQTVLATDIFDKELTTRRKERWEMAFKNDTGDHTSGDVVDKNRKATIVIEHLIQASDVAHTMQHWHIYQKWNERLFAEMLDAYNTGRWNRDPVPGWYQGELGFFDNYVIPLAKKLQGCGVFGVSSDEYLNYALENRREWARKGEEVIEKMIKKYGYTPPAPEPEPTPEPEVVAEPEPEPVKRVRAQRRASIKSTCSTRSGA